MAATRAWKRSVFSIAPLSRSAPWSRSSDGYGCGGVASCCPADDKALVGAGDRERTVFARQKCIEESAARLVGYG